MSSKLIGNIVNIMKNFFYTKTETDTKLSAKSDTTHSHTVTSATYNFTDTKTSLIKNDGTQLVKKGNTVMMTIEWSGGGGAFNNGQYYEIGNIKLPTQFKPAVGFIQHIKSVTTNREGVIQIGNDGAVKLMFTLNSGSFQINETLTYVTN